MQVLELLDEDHHRQAVELRSVAMTAKLCR
jgi:hypothetical protein